MHMPDHKQIRALLAVSSPVANSALRAYFRARGDRIDDASPRASEELLARVSALRPDLIVLELETSTEPLVELHRGFRGLPVIVFAPAQAKIAFEAARLGAVEFLSPPIADEDIAIKLDRVVESLPELQKHLADYHGVSGHPAEPMDDVPRLLSSSPPMMRIHNTIQKVANTSATVLIRGESGVGKEIVARMIFALSERSTKPFVKVNCAAIPGELLESELFGYESGAFTGAMRSKPGKFELADRGTLFLDEIGEMEPRLQAKLLHVLQDGEFSRLGAKHDIAVDVRLVCATNQVLEERVAAGLFREDLFYRINVVTVSVPPLRERRDEIPILLQFFLEKYAAVYRRPLIPLNPEVLQFLAEYEWPGNIRELENLCNRYVIVGDATQIVRELSAHHDRGLALERLPAPCSCAAEEGKPSLIEIGQRAARRAEREAIREMLTATRWNRKEAARRLRVSYKALLNKIRDMELEIQQ
jgi:two-component system, NtrC family, response regulator AtoC